MAIGQFPVEAGHILTFARAIGDDNPVYDLTLAGGTEQGGVIAPPTFVQASAHFDPEYPLRPKIGAPWWGSGKEDGRAPDGGGGGTGLHAEQHYVYHRVLRAGDVLTAEVRPGRSWEKDGRRGGKLLFTESVTEYRNAAGELVVTATAVGVRTEKTVEQDPS